MISVCIITKNEAANLEKCLRALSEYGYEILVADTGSTDDSRRIAQKWASRVLDFPWCDDFAKARNYVADQAENDWILMVDSDEFVTDWDKEAVENLLVEHREWVGRFELINYWNTPKGVSSGKEYVSRLYHRKVFRYAGRIHEQLEPLVELREGYRTFQVPIRMDHVGYCGTPEQMKKKAQRNITLLQKLLQEQGEDPYVYYQIGKGYYMMGDYPAAVPYFEKATCFDLDPHSWYVMDLVETYGYALLNIGQRELALQFENLYHDFSHHADFIFLMGNIYMENARFDDAVAMFEAAAKVDFCTVQGVNSFLAYYNCGVIRECQGKLDEARRYYELCGSYELAEQALERLEREK